MHSVCRSRDPAAGRVVHQDRLDEGAVGQAMEGLLGLAAVGDPELGVADGVEAESPRRAPSRRPAGSVSTSSNEVAPPPHTASLTWRAR